jgi:hypothetical protein
VNIVGEIGDVWEPCHELVAQAYIVLATYLTDVGEQYVVVAEDG